MLLCDNISETRTSPQHTLAWTSNSPIALPFSSSFPFIIPHPSHLGCYFLSDIHLQQLRYRYNPCCCKTNTLLFLFQFFSFVGNSFCRVRRTFWTLLLYSPNQSFIMAIIEVIVATFEMKCIIWCQWLYDSRALINPG